MRPPRVIVSSVSGKSGKTIITAAIIKGLEERGYIVQPFKVGPDFIDPSYHNLCSSRQSRNLDSIIMARETILSSFLRAMKKADVGVIEGVFGLHDSVDGITENGSTAQMSKILKAPVILILNAERINRGLLAVIKGFREFDREVRVRGVIINNLGSERQRSKIVDAIRNHFSDLEIVGTVERSELIEEVMRYRHLGLVPVSERGMEIEKLVEAVKLVADQIDIDKVITLAQDVEELPEIEESQTESYSDKRIGVMKDPVFSFYYPENLEYLNAVSRKVFYVNSLRDETLPDIDLLYIGGGFPEVFAGLLEKNRPLQSEIKRKVRRGMKVYAECGGLMYLSERIRAYDGGEYTMVGLIEGYVEMCRRPVGHGYVYLRSVSDNPLTERGREIVGHEFHYSKLVLKEKVDFAFKVLRGYGVDGLHDGIMKENILAMYTHLHVLHDRGMFDRLIGWPGRV